MSPVQVVQPVVKAVAPPDVTPTATPAAVASASPFGPPKRVKTVAVRADGSVITGPGAADPAIAPGGNAASLVNPPLPASRPFAAIPTVTAAPSTPSAKPKATVRVAAPAKPEPKPPVASQASPPPAAANAGARDGNAPLQLNSAGGKPSRIKVADAAATGSVQGSAGSTGKFAVQLAAPADQQEAKDASARFQRQYAEALAGHTPTIKAADSAGRTVYRVRVGGLSRDQANALCAKLKSSGGNCFVAGN